MAHPSVHNRTPYAFEPLFLMDEELRPLCVPLVQATYAVGAGADPVLAEEQPPIEIGGEVWDPDAEQPCYRREPELAFLKLGVDVLFNGHVHPARARATEQLARFRVAGCERTVRVIGDRTWVRAWSGVRPGPPAPLEPVPLSYARAFGGWDRTHDDPRRHRCETRNPVGRGFRRRRSRFEEGVVLPNLEDPERPLRAWGQRVAPCGVGVVAPGWEPRAGLAGTYDEGWQLERMPKLPRDFDRRFFSSGSPGLVLEALRGGEPVRVENVAPGAPLELRLPALAPPVCTVHGRARKGLRVETALDTVVVDTDALTLSLLWRGHAALRDGPHEVRAVEIEAG